MPNEVMKAGPFTWYDKLPVKFHDNDGQKISESGHPRHTRRHRPLRLLH